MERVHECYRALLDCHNRNAYQSPRRAELEPQFFDPISNSSTASGSRLSVSGIAQQLAQEASRCLSRDEFQQLLAFLENPGCGSRKTEKQLQKSLTERLEIFYSKEIIESGQSRERLASPGGPPNADLGIILHIQSEEDTIGHFWDSRSVTIRLLEEKGLDKVSCFGFDWHWRAEETFHGRTSCPAHQWSLDLKRLHHELSCDVLEILPLPFIICASSCTRKNIRKTFSKEAKFLEIPVVPPANVLKIDLDFQNGTLRRIIFHVHHPCAGFFAGRVKRPGMAMLIDTGIDFMLWLTGRKYTHNVFGREYSRSVPRMSKAAPLAEMHAYVRKEREEQRVLKLEDYAPCFLSWAGRYLQTDPAIIISRKESVAEAAVKKIGQRISEALLQKHNNKTKEQAKSATQHTRLYSTSNAPKPGSGKRSSQKRKRAASIAASKVAVDEHQLDMNKLIPINTPTTFQQGITIEQEELSVIQEDSNSLSSSDLPATLADQQTHALLSLSPARTTIPLSTGRGGKSLTQDDEDEFNPSDSSTTENDQERAPIYEPFVNEVAIPMPTDDQGDQGYPLDSSSVAESTADDLNDFETLFNGRPVRILQNGVVKLHKPSYRDLRFRMSNKEAKRILKFKKATTIHFTFDEIRLCIDNDIVYQKPVERLLGSKEGPEWLVQITQEFKSLSLKTSETGSGHILDNDNKFAVITHSTSLGTNWKNGELQRKLRQGAKFTCNPLKNGTNMGRICVRGVQLLVPETADFETVHVQCDLLNVGLQHPNACASYTRDEDPASRLGIKVIFKPISGGEMGELWATLGGEANTKKLNSLVDFLDGKDEQWTEQQPRRFLDKNKGRGRTRPSYTS